MPLQGFVESYYLEQKLQQLQETNPQQWGSNSTVADVRQAINNSGLTVEQHYSQYGYQEGLAPNAFFDPQEYVRAKATALFNEQGSEYQSVDAAAEAFVNAWGGNVYQHYLQFGAEEGINPSNQFDQSSYLEEKLQQLQNSGNTEITTTEELLAAFEQAGLTPLSHFIEYGREEGLAAVRVTGDERVSVIDGATRTLTVNEGTAGDRLFGTSNNDLFDATKAGSLQSADQLLDQSTTDQDVLNATISSANTDAAPTILNVENVNLDLQVFSGAKFNAANVEGATITASSTKLGFNGEFTLDGAGNNDVVAGNNVQNLTVNGLTGGMVNAGNANTVAVAATKDSDAANVTTRGDLDLTVTKAETLNLTAARNATVDLTPNAVTTLNGSGSGDLTVTGVNSVTTISGVETARINTTGTVDATKWDVDTIDVAAGNGTNVLTVANGANVTVSETQNDLTVNGQTTANLKDSVTVTSGLDNLGTLSFSELTSANLNLTAASTIASLATGGANTTVNVAGNTAINALTAASNTVSFAGKGNVTVDADTKTDGIQGVDAKNVDASGLNGALTLATNAAGATVQGGSGNNTVTFETTKDDATYTGQSGDDTVTFSTDGGNASATFAGGSNTVKADALTTGTLAVEGGSGAETISATSLAGGTLSGELGGGNDTLTLGTVGQGSGATIAVDFGAGTDTLQVAGGSDLTGNSVNLVNLENIEITGNADGSVTFSASQLSGKNYSISSENGGATLTVEGTAAANTINLSGLQLNNTAGENVAGATINGLGGNDTITGTSGNDTINGGAGADTMTGGAGVDTFGIATNAVTANAADVVTDFRSAGNDLISFGGGAGTTTNYAEGAAAVADFAAAQTAANAQLDAGSGVAYSAQQVGSDLWVFADTGGGTDGAADGTADAVVRLAGVSLDQFQADMIAG